ncbi:MAG: cephalosporin hydroxylase family protein [Ignavibacteria bacterium]|nr:cephalosporin hydroxylase family protein [Ignavibacteria bacterium]
MNLRRQLLARIRRFLTPPENTEEEFHSKYYYSKVWSETYFLGRKVFKCPGDLWMYQEIFWKVRPDIAIECGTFQGGSALYFAKLMDIMEINGKVISIDVDPMPDLPFHPKITYIQGSSISNEVVDKVRNLVSAQRKVIVILDSDHSKEHVLKEMEIYNSFVTDGSYLVVEDSNLNGHPVHAAWGTGPGPYEAIEEFLKTHSEFEIDKSCEKFMMTFNPNGWLKKIETKNK